MVKAKGDEKPVHHPHIGHVESFVQYEGQVPDLGRLKGEWKVKEWKQHVDDFKNFLGKE